MAGLDKKIREYNTGSYQVSNFLDKLIFWKDHSNPIPVYDPEVDGQAVVFDVPEGFMQVEWYWIDEPYVYISILKKNSLNYYHIVEPALKEYEKEVLERTYNDLRDVLTIDDMKAEFDREIVLVTKTVKLFKHYNISLDNLSKYKILYFLRRNFLGFGRINALMLDPNIEDISCDGVDVPIYLYHQKYHNIETNLAFNEEKLNSFVISLCQRSGKHISISEPLVDATLPDGSRLQATLGREITTRGSSFNVRKFHGDPITPIDLIQFGTCNIEMMVYFWMAIENGFSAIFAGGTASGKTTLLNATSLFIPPLSKIVSIEDTREIMLYHDNWIASVTRASITKTSAGEVSMYDLLRSALRQRPETIIVGEVRGAEALTLFQALSTGHTTYSTMHAGDVQTVVNRLESEPINVPHVMLQSLDILCIQKQVLVEDNRVRRANLIVEITGMDPKSGDLTINELYEWVPATDTFRCNGHSFLLKRIIQKRGWDEASLQKELEQRSRILGYMVRKNIRDYVRMSVLVKTYSISPDIVIDSIEHETLEKLLESSM